VNINDPFISDLVNALVIALVPVVIGGVGYIARALINYLKARMSAEQYRIIEMVAATTVASLEQSLKGQAGQAKKEAALALVRAECLKRGIKLDEDAIQSAIEAAVYRTKLQV
jgi:LL-H family phage holin